MGAQAAQLVCSEALLKNLFLLCAHAPAHPPTGRLNAASMRTGEPGRLMAPAVATSCSRMASYAAVTACSSGGRVTKQRAGGMTCHPTFNTRIERAAATMFTHRPTLSSPTCSCDTSSRFWRRSASSCPSASEADPCSGQCGHGLH